MKMIDKIIQNGDKLELDNKITGAALIHYKDNVSHYEALCPGDALIYVGIAAHVLNIAPMPKDEAFSSLLARRDMYTLREQIDEIVERAEVDRRRALNILYFITADTKPKRKATITELPKREEHERYEAAM